jgi:DNA-binding NarL/FixJ family response regulator
LTLCDNPEYRIAAEEIGADGFVAKSDFTTELCPTIDRVLGVSSRPLSDS